MIANDIKLHKTFDFKSTKYIKLEALNVKMDHTAYTVVVLELQKKTFLATLT